MSDTDLSEFEPLVGKRCVLQYTKDGDEEVLEAKGTLEKIAVGKALLFKEKGRQTAMHFSFDVVGVTLDETVDNRIKQKRLIPVPDHQVRQHLADRHGAPLSAVNAMSDEQAVATHNDLHSKDTAKNIAHYHKEKAVKAAAAEPSPGA